MAIYGWRLPGTGHLTWPSGNPNHACLTTPFHMDTWLPKSWIITLISVLNLPSRLVHQLVTSPLLDFCINGSMTASRLSMNKIYIIFRSVLVVGSLLAMITSYRQETLFLVVEQMTIHPYSNGLFLMWWDVVNIKPPWHLKICKVI
jgi:hypothetical protein